MSIKSDDFQLLLSPIDTMISVSFIEHIRDNLENHCNTYKDEVFTSENSLKELNILLKDTVIKTESYLSKNYKKKLLDYFNEESLSLYIYSQLKQLMTNCINNDSDCIPKRRF